MANDPPKKSIRNTFKIIGPGILMAGAAVGVSHLVQATRAGADYGPALWWALVLACVSKYPFLEFGPRYAAATGESLVSAYRKLGTSNYLIFIAITVGTMFIVLAAVTMVTAGLAEQFFGMGWSVPLWSVVILGLCLTLLLIGRYPWLDKAMKIIITLLTLSTLIAVIIALFGGTGRQVLATPVPSYFHVAGFAFIISFMGWMPIPLDAAVWHSIWIKERTAQTRYRPTFRESLLDFNIGYLSAAFIGVLFFGLGILIMFGSGEEFPNSSVAFSGKLVQLYGETLGNWATPVIAVAALVTMLSTTLAVADAYPRVISEVFLESGWFANRSHRVWGIYRLSAPVIALVSLMIITWFSSRFTAMIDVATALSFLAAPVLAWFSIQITRRKILPVEAAPGRNYNIFTWLCFAFLVIFSLMYIYMSLFM